MYRAQHRVPQPAAPPLEDVRRQNRPLIAHMVRAFHSPAWPYPDKDDLEQVALIALWQAYIRCTNWTTFPGFAKCVIRAAVIDLVRAERRHPPPLSLDTRLPIPGDLTLRETLALSADDQDLALSVHQSLAPLPPKQAANLWAVKGLGWPATAWARIRGQHVNTVKQSIARGRRNFRKTWHRAPASESMAPKTANSCGA